MDDGMFGADGSLPPDYGSGITAPGRQGLDRGDPARGMPMPSHSQVSAKQAGEFPRVAPDVNGFGAATDGRKVPSRDVPGKDGKYLYRQFKGGDILILVSPRKTENGLLVTQATHPQAWLAITNEIGTWDDYAAGRLSTIITATSKGLSTLVPALSAGGGGKKGGGKFKPSHASLPAAGSDTTALTAGTLPTWLPWAAGAAGAAVVLFLLYRSMKGGK